MGGVEYDLKIGPAHGIRTTTVLTQATHDVFHRDDGVVHQRPHGDGDAAQGHGVYGRADGFQDQQRNDHR